MHGRREEDLCEKDAHQGRGHSHTHKCMEEVPYEGISYVQLFPVQPMEFNVLTSLGCYRQQE